MKIKNLIVNKKTLSLLLAGTLTLTTLVGCGNESARIEELEQQVKELQEEIAELKGDKEISEVGEVSVNEESSIITEESNKYQSNDYKISMTNVFALESENRTLFVRYDSLDDDYVTDIFTGEIYKFKRKGEYANSVRQLERYKVNIYRDIYVQRSIGEIVPELIGRTTENAPASLLKKAYEQLNGKPTMMVNIENANVDISHIVTLKNEQNQILFVKYDSLDDDYVTDIFTGEVYKFKQTYRYANSVAKFGVYKVNIYGGYYSTIPLSHYPDVIAQVREGKISMDFLKKLFKELNHIVDYDYNGSSENLVDIQKLLVLKNDNSTLYAYYNDLSNDYVIDAFTSTECQFQQTYRYANSVNQLGLYKAKIFGDLYSTKPTVFEPGIIDTVEDFKVPFELLYESYLTTNGMTYDDIEKSKQITLK